jgi:hypothetical protein
MEGDTPYRLMELGLGTYTFSRKNGDIMSVD